MDRKVLIEGLRRRVIDGLKHPDEVKKVERWSGAGLLRYWNSRDTRDGDIVRIVPDAELKTMIAEASDADDFLARLDGKARAQERREDEACLRRAGIDPMSLPRVN